MPLRSIARLDIEAANLLNGVRLAGSAYSGNLAPSGDRKRTRRRFHLDFIASIAGKGMPTSTCDPSNPAHWRFPAIPLKIMNEVRNSKSGFNRDLSSSRKMGNLLERGMAARGLVGRADFVLFEAKPAIAETLTWCRQ